MSSFMKKGKRNSVNTTNKKRMEEVYKIIDECDSIAVDLIKYSAENKIPINRKDIVELAKQFSDMPIDTLEEGLIWSKIQDFGKRLEQYRKDNGTGEEEKEGDNI